MRIGIVVDGDAESQALRNVTRRINIPGVQVIDPIYAPMQPNADPCRIVSAAVERIEALVAVRQVDKVLVLIDRELRPECPGEWSKTLAATFHAAGYLTVCVIVKNRKLENWLIADVEVFRNAKGRYRVTNAFVNAVVPNKADNVLNAEAMLNSIVLGSAYHKRRDAARITEAQDIATIAKHSRSFRRFLRCLGHASYSEQSKRPAA